MGMVEMHTRLLDASDHLISLIATVNEELTGMPETSATFRLSDLIDVRYLNAGSRQKLMKDFCGYWKMPEIYSQGNDTGQLYVNPYYSHSYRFPEVWSRCKGCGNIQVHPQGKDSEVDPPIPGCNDHGECNRIDRMEARLDIMKQRKEVLDRGLTYGFERLALAKRIGLRTNSISEVCQSLGLGVENSRQRFIEERNETIVKLIQQGYSAETISNLYRISDKHTWKVAKRESGMSAWELREAQA